MADIAQVPSGPVLEFSGKNFQAWNEFHLSVDGFTVVIGPSNQGKSSIYRALRAVFRNDLAAGYVKTGEKATELTAVIGGHTITARRTAKGSTKYTMDGEDYAKLNGDIPPPLAEMRLGEVEVGGVRFDPIFSRQLERQFLLEEAPATLNTILGAFSSTDRLEHGKRQANVRIQVKNGEAKTLAEDIFAADTEVARLQALEDRSVVISAELAQLEADCDRLHLSVEALDRLLQQQFRLETTRATVKALHIPELQPLHTSVAVIATATTAISALEHVTRTQTLLRKLTVADIAPVQALAQTAIAAQNARSAQERLTANTALSGNITVVLGLWERLVAQYKRLKSIVDTGVALAAQDRSRVLLVSQLGAVIVKLEALKVPVDSFRTIQHLEQISTSQAKVNAAHTAITEATKSIEEMEAAREEIVRLQREAVEAAARVECPECGKSFVPAKEHVHA